MNCQPKAPPPGSRLVFILAGEASGDRYGAALIEALRAADSHLTFRGIGGPLMRAAGAHLLWDSSHWGTIGIGEALANLNRLRRRLRQVVAHLRDQPPALLVLVDFGAFNVRVARALAGAGIPLLYFIPPGSWSRQRRRGDLTHLVDAIATPFEWSARHLEGGRARVEWVGHPLLDLVHPTMPRQEAYRSYHLDPGQPVVALVPGSRSHELSRILPVMTRTASILAQAIPQTQFLVPVAATAPREVLATAFKGLETRLLDGMDYNAMQLADVAAATSGTATLELAILGVPMVVVYRGSRLTELQYALVSRVLRRVAYVALPNLIAGRVLVPELLQAQATPRRIAAELTSLLSNESRRQAMLRDLNQVAHVLGEPGALRRTAALALDLMAR